jgi:hypothetical protein
MSEEELTLVIELQGATIRNFAKLLEVVRETLQSRRFEGMPYPVINGFLFKEPPVYAPRPILEWSDGDEMPAEEVNLTNVHDTNR